MNFAPAYGKICRMGQELRCEEAERLIPHFLKDELQTKTMEAFLRHIEGCPACREELSIQYLVAEGLSRLEEGETFDFNAGLSRKLEGAGRRVRFHRRAQIAALLLELLIVLGLAGVIVRLFVFS